MVPTRRVLVALVGAAAVLTGCPQGPTGPTIDSFVCNPSNLPDGAGPVTLSWAVSGALSVTIEPMPGTGSPSGGSATVQLTATTTFTLTATNLSGSSSATCQVTVAQPPVINSFTATPPNLPNGGGPVVFAWNVTGAASLSIDHNVGVVTPVTVGNKTVLVGVTTTFTLTAMDSAGNTIATAQVTVAPPVMSPTVTGTVVDIRGQPAAGQTVLITSTGAFSQTVVTDSNGQFTVPDVPAPYNATVIQAAQAVQYQGLTRADPTLTAFFFLTNNRSASLAGSLSGGMYPETADYQTQLVFVSPQTIRSLGDPVSGNYSNSIPWPGPSSTAGSLYALQIHNVANLPADYPGYGTLGGVSLTDTGSVSGQNVALGPVTSGSLSGTITPPTGYAVYYKSVELQVAANLTLSAVFDQSTGATFTYVTPAVAGTTLTVTAAAMSASGEFSAVLKADQSANGSLTFDVPPAPTLSSPPASSTGVTVNTSFAWTTYPTAIYEFEAESTTGPTFYVLTAATTTTIPDLSSFGLPLPVSTNYTWSVEGLGPISSIDLLAAPGGINQIAVDLSEGISVSQAFTTAP